MPLSLAPYSRIDSQVLGITIPYHENLGDELIRTCFSHWHYRLEVT
jgi:hypothetical protein